MKRKDDLGVGGYIFMTVIFAIMAFVTFQSNDWKPEALTIGIIPIAGIIYGIAMAFNESNKNAEKEARQAHQESFSRTVEHDSSFGNGDLKLYFNTPNKTVTLCATTTANSNQKTVDNFVKGKAVETDEHSVAVDVECNKLIRAKNANGNININECYLKSELIKLGIDYKKSTPALKAYNDYAFVTDDVNEFVAIVTPTKIHVHRYEDIVSISYEENGTDIYNKSLGGAVVGGLLFGGVGAIVGSNTAKTQQKKEVRKMSIKILLKSTSDSTIVLKIYEAGKDGNLLETKKASDLQHYEGLMKEVAGIKDIFSIIIDIVDKNLARQKTAQVVQPTSTSSVADELMKLAKLKDAGVLSEEEFNTQKNKLLNS